MESEKGIWKISTGKGNRIYINCKEEEVVMHPGHLCAANGLGIYGYEHLKEGCMQPTEELLCISYLL